MLEINIPFVIHGLLFNFFSFLDFLLRGACLLNVMLKISRNLSNCSSTVHILDGRHFTILCDNQAVIQSLTKKNSEHFLARILRQFQYISQFSTDYQLIESDKNAVADVLTRANVTLISDLPDALYFEAIAEEQKSDADI